MEQTDGLPQIQGIQLIGTHQLADRIKPIFPFPVFNAIQSKCFQTVYRTDDNFVLSSPTGSGKTAILELAICRLASSHPGKGFKIVYQAPTKSLCSERYRDWSEKFRHLNLKCAELTGDTGQGDMRAVQAADILVTTPEKWDSMTRQWRDHRKLMDLVKLFLIDEVHILKEDRGASLEVVVSRMKSVGTDVRLIALSATVPNSEDIAKWFGQNNRVPGMPAAREVFGEEFRPVKLQRHVVGLPAMNQNDFVFDASCNSKLPEVIARHSVGKPIMIFCCTKKGTEQTAQLLAEWWTKSDASNRYWKAPKSAAAFAFQDTSLRKCAIAGVAFHHAGLSQSDRATIERGYLNGDINVICCTSTLAAGVNLPCHFVIIKNTIGWTDAGSKEYSDLDMMQMLGRAGRPQFDRSAIAVVMTRIEKVDRYEKMVSGQEILESKLHLNLIEHLNAEIVLGTVKDFQTAAAWLQGTFFYQRFLKNPDHYHIAASRDSTSPERIIEELCKKDLDLLREYLLISGGQKFKATAFGDAMARYYVQFETMKMLICLQAKARTSEIISALAQANELRSIKLRGVEKPIFKEINSSPSIKYPIPVDLAMGPHKISLMIQATLGGLDFQHDEHFGKHRQQLLIDRGIIFQHVPRLVRCIIDCALHREDSIAVRNALELSRSLGARIWDDSPLQLMQIDKIGPVAARKLVGANLKTVEDLEYTESQKIDMILSKNPPFGLNVLKSLQTFPKLRISLQKIGQPRTKTSGDGGQYLSMDVKAELGFLNENPPLKWRSSAVYVTMLAETSDGRVAHFCRISAQKIGLGENILFAASLTAPRQLITCHVACDNIVGTLKSAMLDPKIPASAFASLVTAKAAKERARETGMTKLEHDSEDFDDFDIDDTDLMTAATGGFDDIDEFAATPPPQAQVNVGKKRKMAEERATRSEIAFVPKQLPNGRWQCQHTCKDKTNCKHICCHEGLEDKPRLSKKKKQQQLEMKQSEAPNKSPIDDYFKQSKKQAASRNEKAQKQMKPKLEEEQEGPRFGTNSPRYEDPFDLDQGVSGIAANDLRGARSTIPTQVEPSSHGLFLTSSPIKRPIEAVDLSDPSPHFLESNELERSLGKRGGTKTEDLDEDFYKTYERAATDDQRDHKKTALYDLNEDKVEADDIAASTSQFYQDDHDFARPTIEYNEAQFLSAAQPTTSLIKPYVSLAELENSYSRPSPSLATDPRSTVHQTGAARTSGTEAYLMSDGDGDGNDDIRLSGPFDEPEPGRTISTKKAMLKTENPERQRSAHAEVRTPAPVVKDELVDWFKQEFGDFAECV